jgi:spore coat polysaccharide biosynthesis protein SpsF (cytidylyltransferase family)
VKNIHIFIQCRIGSKRLPAKAFHTFFNIPIILRIIKISKLIKFKKKKIYIITDRKTFDFLKPIAQKENINLFYGPEKDVAQRYLRAIKSYTINPEDYLLRLTADNYLIQPKILEKMIKLVDGSEYEYVYIEPLSHFAGEIFTVKIFLEKMLNRKISKFTKEHVTYDFRKRRNILKLDKNFMGINHARKITLDNIKDLIFLKKLEMKFPDLKNIDCLNTIKKISNL